MIFTLLGLAERAQLLPSPHGVISFYSIPPYKLRTPHSLSLAIDAFIPEQKSANRLFIHHFLIICKLQILGHCF